MSDDDSYATSSDEEYYGHQDEDAAPKTWQELKELGNSSFKEGDYDEAISNYSAALDSIEKQNSKENNNNNSLGNAAAILLSNRSMCHTKLCKFQNAESDARKSIEKDPAFVKSLNRLGQALCGLGRFDDAVTEYTRGMQLAKSRNDRIAIAELAECVRDAKVASDAISDAKSFLLAQSKGFPASSASSSHENNMGSPSSSAGSGNNSPTTSSPIHHEVPTSLAPIAKAVADAYLKYTDCFALNCLFAEINAAVDPERAAAVLSRIASHSSPLRPVAENSADYAYVRALVAYHGNATTGTQNAQQLLRQAIELDPDNVKIQRMLKKVRNIEAKKAAGNEAYKGRRWKEAVSLYTEAMSFDSTNKRLNGVLLGNRSAAKIEIPDVHGALADINAAIDRGNDAAKIFARRSKIYEKLDKFDEAKQDLKKAAEMDEDVYGGREMKDFEERMRIAKRKDYYKILGVEKNASPDQIKQGGRKGALKWHPDRWASGSPTEKDYAETQFKEVQEALSLLSDPQKRRHYDAGRMDNEAEGVRGGGGGGMPGGMGGGVDLSDLMGMFGGGMGGMPPGMGGGGGGRRRGGGGGGPPPGFSFSFG